MNPSPNARITRIFSLGLLAGLATVSMAVNDDGACGGGSFPAPDARTDTDTREEPLQCRTAADCASSVGSADRIACDGNWQCVDNMCEWSCETPTTGCHGDDACAPGFSCNAAEVCLNDPNCPECDVCYGWCVEDTTPTGCYGDQDCAAGYTCNAADVCRPPPGCQPGEACPAVCYGECVESGPQDTCYSNDECARGQVCDFSRCGGDPAALIACGGVCVDEDPTPTCTSQADCDNDELCACVPPGFSMPSALVACELQCVPRDAQCFNDLDCKEGYTCLDFQCTAAPEACWSNDDCPRGWTCEDDCGMSTDPDGADRIACPRSCKAPTTGSTCGENGPTCAAGELCEETCWVEVADCACTPDDSDCACPGSLVCVATCVPENGWGECRSDADCPRGEACGCNPDASGACVPTCMPIDAPWDCTSDADCRDGFCRIEVCEAAEPCDGGDCRPAAPSCWGYCQPAYDCTSDADCREGGSCKIDQTTCGGTANDPLMPPACQGWCTYPTEEPCGPDGLICNADEVCQETWDCGTGSDERVPCWARYECVPAVNGCRSDADCEASAVCIDGACEVQYCWDGVCPDGFVCTPGCDALPALPNGLVMCPMVCQPAPTACESDCDCNINEACVSGACVEIAGANDCRQIGCGGDDECAAGQTCMVRCPLCLPDNPCPPCEGVCVDNDPTTGCYSDTDCPRGQICDYNTTPPTDTCDCTDCSCDPAARPMPMGTCVVPDAQ